MGWYIIMEIFAIGMSYVLEKYVGGEAFFNAVFRVQSGDSHVGLAVGEQAKAKRSKKAKKTTN